MIAQAQTANKGYINQLKSKSNQLAYLRAHIAKLERNLLTNSPVKQKDKVLIWMRCSRRITRS